MIGFEIDAEKNVLNVYNRDKKISTDFYFPIFKIFRTRKYGFNVIPDYFWTYLISKKWQHYILILKQMKAYEYYHQKYNQKSIHLINNKKKKIKNKKNKSRKKINLKSQNLKPTKTQKQNKPMRKDI